jgi:hypothetical protein
MGGRVAAEDDPPAPTLSALGPECGGPKPAGTSAPADGLAGGMTAFWTGPGTPEKN